MPVLVASAGCGPVMCQALVCVIGNTHTQSLLLLTAPWARSVHPGRGPLAETGRPVGASGQQAPPGPSGTGGRPGACPLS